MRGIPTVDLMMNLTVTELSESRSRLGSRPEGIAELLRDEESLTCTGHPAQRLFHDASTTNAGVDTMEDQLRLMDSFGVQIGFVDVPLSDPEPYLALMRAHPGRLFGVVTFNPHRGMTELRQLEAAIRANPEIKACAVLGQAIQRPYDDKIYWPLYAKACELDLPVFAYVGLPGPRVPGAAQDPMALDEIMWFFPELKVVMRHGGEPWEDVCVKLMLRWPNLYYSTSGFAPRYYPASIVAFANTRGTSQVLFAGYTPTLSYERLSRELDDLPLRDHVWSPFLRDNATALFNL